MYSINDKCIEFPGVLKPLAGSLLRLHERIVLDTIAGHANKRNDALYTQSMAYSEKYSHRRQRLTIDVCSYVHRRISFSVQKHSKQDMHTIRRKHPFRERLEALQCSISGKHSKDRWSWNTWIQSHPFQSRLSRSVNQTDQTYTLPV